MHFSLPRLSPSLSPGLALLTYMSHNTARTPLARRGIRLSVVAPGFVRSGITARNRFPMPFLMDADRAAAIIMRGLAANRGRIAFPFPTYFGAWLLNTMPNWLAEKLTAGMPDKT